MKAINVLSIITNQCLFVRNFLVLKFFITLYNLYTCNLNLFAYVVSVLLINFCQTFYNRYIFFCQAKSMSTFSKLISIYALFEDRYGCSYIILNHCFSYKRIPLFLLIPTNFTSLVLCSNIISSIRSSTYF